MDRGFDQQFDSDVGLGISERIRVMVFFGRDLDWEIDRDVDQHMENCCPTKLALCFLQSGKEIAHF